MIHFFNFSVSLLKKDEVYSFPLFFYDARAKKRHSFLAPDAPLSEELVTEQQEREGRGVFLQVYYEDLEDFGKETQVELENLRSYNQAFFICDDLSKEREDKYSSIDLEGFVFKDEFFKSFKDQNYNFLKQCVLKNIMQWPLYESSFLSDFSATAEKLFLHSHRPVLIATCAFLVALDLGIKDHATLASLIFACLLMDIGETQIPLSSLNSEGLENSDLWKKHPMLSLYVLSKGPYDINNQTKRFILEHHEMANGRGFPRAKKVDKIHRLSLVISFWDQFFSDDQLDLESRLSKLLTRAQSFDDQQLNLTNDLIEYFEKLKPKVSE